MAIWGVVFDAYGTLLDVHSAMQRYAERIGPNWAEVSAAWRAKQLEYSWIRSLAGPAHHRDFGVLTDAALDFVAARFGIADQALLADLRTALEQGGDATLHRPAVKGRVARARRHLVG